MAQPQPNWWEQYLWSREPNTRRNANTNRININTSRRNTSRRNGNTSRRNSNNRRNTRSRTQFSFQPGINHITNTVNFRRQPQLSFWDYFYHNLEPNTSNNQVTSHKTNKKVKWVNNVYPHLETRLLKQE